MHPIRVIEPRNSPIRNKRSQHGVDQKVELINTGTDHARHHAFAEQLNPVIDFGALPFYRKARAFAGNHQKDKLRDTGQCHAPRQRVGRGLCDRGQAKQRTNQAQIKDNRGGGSGGIAMQGVENPRHQGDRGNKGQIGEGDARQFDGKREFFRIVGKSGREYKHCPWHQNFNDRDQKAGDQQQHRHGTGGKFARNIHPAFFNIAGQKRDKGRGKRAFAKQAAK